MGTPQVAVLGKTPHPRKWGARSTKGKDRVVKEKKNAHEEKMAGLDLARFAVVKR